MGSRSRESMSSDDDELHGQSPMDSEDDEFDDADSGAGSDDFDLLELGESGSEFCQVGDQTCCIPFELYDLPDLRGILSLDVWNECLTEEERFSLTQYLPEMDQETYMHTLKELFEGTNFHFGSPLTKLFEMLIGGSCEPRVALYRQGLSFFQRHQHYHLIRNHHNSMVSSLLQIREAWQNCKGYSIDNKLRVLNILRSQKSLMGERMEYMQTDSSEQEDYVDVLWGKKSQRRNFVEKPGYAVNRMSPSLDFVSRGRSSAVQSSKISKQNSKGILKLVGSKAAVWKDLPANVDPRRQAYQGLKHAPSGSRLHLSRKAARYDSRAPAWQIRDQMDIDDDVEVAYGMDHQRNRNLPISHRSGFSKSQKKHRVVTGDEYVGESYINIPTNTDFSAYAMNMNVNQLSDIKVLTANPPNVRTSCDYGKKSQYLELTHDNQMTTRRVLSKANHAGFPDRSQTFLGKKTKGEVDFPVSPSLCDEWDVRGQKSKLGKSVSDAKLRTSRTCQRRMDSILFDSEQHAKPLLQKIRRIPAQEGGPTIASSKISRVLSRGEETESDSSAQFNEEEDHDPLMISKLAILSDCLENSESSVPKYGVNRKKGKKAKKGKKQIAQTIESSIPQVLEDNYFYALDKSETERNKKATKRNSKNGQMRAAAGGSLPLPLRKVSRAPGRRNGALEKDSSGQSNYLQDYFAEEDGNLLEDGQFGACAQNGEANAVDHDSTLIGCHSVAMKKRKAKEGAADVDFEEYSDYMNSASKHLLDEFPSARRKRVKKKVESDTGAFALEVPSPVKEITVLEVELEPKPPRKFTLITPTIHTGFSFSVVHLFSAVRVAMSAPKREDSLDTGKHFEDTDKSQKITEDMNGKYRSLNGSLENLDVNKSEYSGQMNVPVLSFQEIVNRVRSNPGDTCILETQEPLHDLIRGVLKILSSRIAPLGAKGWKPLVYYDKSTKFWSWIGPMSQSSLDQKAPEAVASPEAWGIPHKMLVKLVDSFATWLKSGQETLKQIGSLPAPPVELMQINLDEKERFRDLRAQKSLSTINPSSEEVRAYFRKEEQLRYSFPDRAFSYTAADGKKSIVAPLRKCGGKPTSKARDHPMLKRDRPPHVTILCLVRDAAARLPGSIGTRADVCTLIRDSQYIVEDVIDSQVNQVVSGALDRLHYELDPCVQFDGERKLWVYLHRGREEEDFEDDGTSSTKKWKRPKKDAAEQFDQGTPTVACPVSEEQTAFDLSSDLNAEPSCADDNEKMEILYDHT